MITIFWRTLMEDRLTAAQIRKLSVADRILLVQDIWEQHRRGA